MTRDADTQHERLQEAMRLVSEAANGRDSATAHAALQDQAVQAVTLCALELRALRLRGVDVRGDLNTHPT